MPPRHRRLPETVKPFWDDVSLPPPQSGISSPAESPSGKSARPLPRIRNLRNFTEPVVFRPDSLSVPTGKMSESEMRRLFLQMSDQGLSAFRLSPSPATRKARTSAPGSADRADIPHNPAPPTGFPSASSRRYHCGRGFPPFRDTPGCSPGKTLSAPYRLQKRKKNQNAPVLPDSPAETLFSASFPPYSPASIRFSVAFRKQYTRLKEQNQEQKKARPDRTGSGKLTSLRRFLCLCKRWNRLFSLLWRESDWSCSG